MVIPRRRGAGTPKGVVPALRAANPDAADRVLLCRALTAAAVIRVIWHLPPGEVLHDYATLLNRAEVPTGSRPVWSPARYAAVRSVAMTSVAAWGLGVDHPAVKATANASFAGLQRHVVGLHPDLWSYTSNLNVYLALLSLTDGRPTPSPGHLDPTCPAQDTELAVLTGLRTLFASVYLQSGLSKLVVTGWRWGNGVTLGAALGELGTPLGKELARADSRLLAAASTATMLFELGYAPALLAGRRHRSLLGLSSIAFHGSVKATMGISFWHVSWFSVPLLMGRPETVGRVADTIRAVRPRSRTGVVAAAAGGAVLATWPFVQTRYQRHRRTRFARTSPDLRASHPVR